MIDKVNSFYEKTDNKILKYQDIEIKSLEIFLESGQILDILYKPCSSQTNIDLINSIAKKYGIKNNRILSILKSVDRADFYDKFDKNNEEMKFENTEDELRDLVEECQYNYPRTSFSIHQISKLTTKDPISTRKQIREENRKKDKYK